MTDYKFRWAIPDDFDALGQLMFDAVRLSDSPYSDEQRQVWAPQPRKGEVWSKRLNNQDIILAETKTQAAGFMTLKSNGYVDFAYIRPEFQGTGFFRRLYTQIEIKAGQRGIKRLHTHASQMARPAFRAMGFKLLAPQTVHIDGISFERFEMEKFL